VGEVVVDPVRLARTAQQLTQAGDRLRAVSRALTRTSAGSVGHGGLAAALEDFADDWRHGLGQLGEAAGATGGGLAQAARAYAEVDRAVAEACR
jgi:uncharacterized protein YukE